MEIDDVKDFLESNGDKGSEVEESRRSVSEKNVLIAIKRFAEEQGLESKRNWPVNENFKVGNNLVVFGEGSSGVDVEVYDLRLVDSKTFEPGNIVDSTMGKDKGLGPVFDFIENLI